MARDLRISRELALPLDVAGEAIAILAKRGAGKTNTATVLVEEMYAAGVQIVILDPVGAWWGIRSSADGQSEGLAIAVLGGVHGDVPLEQTAGALIADVAVDSGQSLLLDLSDFPSKAAMARFVVDFGERLFRRKNRDKNLLHLVLEEADTFAPQTGKGDDARMRGAIEQIVRRGRSRGIGLTMVTQRSAVLNKDVLSQADVLIAMRTTSPHDTAAIKLWVAAHGDDEQGVIASLPSLETGEAWVWNPERSLLDRVHVRQRATFDSSATPKAGEHRREPDRLAAFDVEKLGKEIQATAERARENDPKELRARVAQLERELAAKPAAETTVERVEVAVVTDETLKEIQALAQRVDDTSEALAGAYADLLIEMRPLASNIRGALNERDRAHAPAFDLKRLGSPAVAAPVEHRPSSRAALPPREPGNVSGPQQKILNALAWFEAIGVTAPRRPPLAAVAGVSSRSSGFRANVSTLSGLGLIGYPEQGRIELTAEGRDGAELPEIAPTTEALHDAICQMVSGPQATLLRVLIAAYPDAVSREQLAERAGVSSASSGFRANISTLSGFELLNYPQPGYVAADPLLFPGDA